MRAVLVTVRVNGTLAGVFGRSRLTVEVRQGATVADVISAMSDTRPEAEDALGGVVAVIDGAGCSRTAPVSEGQEVALLIPMSGG